MPDIDAAHRIRTQRDVTAMVAADNIDAIRDRIANLLAHNRRITLVRRYLADPEAAADVTAGLTVGEFHRWERDGEKGIVARLNPEPGLHTFGVRTIAGAPRTEAAVTDDYYRNKNSRRSMTRVRITGGMDGDRGPARYDQLVIQRWNSFGTYEEITVAFDYGGRA